MAVIVYHSETMSGFVRYELNSNFETEDPTVAPIKKFNDRQLFFTSSYCPDATTWYAMARDSPNNENVLIYFDWNDPNDKARVWVLSSHDTLHKHSIILDDSLSGVSSNLPVRGYYVGETTAFIGTNYCDAADFGETPGNFNIFSSGSTVGHVTRIEMDGD